MSGLDRFAYPFAIDRGFGALMQQGDYDAYIRALVLQVIMTAQGERINRPTFGASIRRLVFAPIGAGAQNFIKAMVLEALDTWLARYVRISDVSVRIDEPAINVDVSYTVISLGQQQVLTMEVAA
jgi:phage baseplate assembly protein W